MPTARLPARQRGIAAVLLVALIATVMIGVLISTLSGGSSQQEFDSKSQPTLATAHAALIAYAVSQSSIPGRLPCPDMDNDGLEDQPCGVADQNAIGRLPWKTLGLPDLRDGSGECLWYAVSGAFKRSPISASPVNSDTAGQFRIVDDLGNFLAGATPQTRAIAVVFAPGPVLETNDRTQAGTTQCGGNSVATNYLDTAGAINNAAPLAPGVATFAAGAPTSTFNDRLIFITPEQFFPSVERRVAAEAKAQLTAYYASNHYYPFANDYTDASYNCTDTITKGRLPRFITAGCPTLADWGAFPAWFFGDQWNQLTYYAVAPACVPATPDCTGAGFLTINNSPLPNNNKQAVVIVAGRALSGQTRPCATVADCLDGATNISGTDNYQIDPPSPIFDDIVVAVGP